MKFGGFVYMKNMKNKLKPRVKPGFNETGNVSFNDIESFFEDLNFNFKMTDEAVNYKTGKQNDLVQVVDFNKKKPDNKETLF